MTGDDQLRDALRSVVEAPAPPARTTLERVVQRGRRRVLVQRGAAVAAVIGVVAAIGVGGVLLRSATAGQGVRPAGTSLSPAPASAAPPPRMKLLPGWTWAPMPTTPGEGGDGCADYLSGHPEGTLERVPPDTEDFVRGFFIDAVREQAGIEPKDAGWQPGHNILEFEIERDGNDGFFELTIDSYGGSADKAADADAASTLDCDPPQRRTLDDGTILQLYSVEAGGGVAARRDVAVYLPGGRYYLLSVGDVGGQGEDAWSVAGGRGPMPLDDTELADVARTLADLAG
jgi:hypothetical protein